MPWLLGSWIVFLDSIHAACVQDFLEIQALEERVNDTSVLRKYIICPYKVISIGYLDYNNDLPEDAVDRVNPPLPLRPNMHVHCGDDGSKANLCFVSDGSFQIDGTEFRGIEDPTLDNILIEGFVFTGALDHSLLVTKPGSITFRNCEWRVRLRMEYWMVHRGIHRFSTLIL